MSMSPTFIPRPRFFIAKRAGNTLHVRSFSHHGLTKAGRPRSLLSSIWTPTGGVSAALRESGHERLIRAGFLRQTLPGAFHLLPLGLRVQRKIEDLLEKHMQSLGASRLSLSSLTTRELWSRSGRLEGLLPELFQFVDRREASLMLSPTHEEEITKLVSKTLHSYRGLPLRLYQMTRKYRDEMRPRRGLTRSREFIMKDLYTFDISPQAAIKTYHEVSKAYRAFFDDLKLRVQVSEASSGHMGGDFSHEFLLVTDTGEDTVAICDQCSRCANGDIVKELSLGSNKGQQDEGEAYEEQKDGKQASKDEEDKDHMNGDQVSGDGSSGTLCPSCNKGPLKLRRALELGHMFSLGTRYSEPLDLRVRTPDGSQEPVPVQMGCYGIGVSRLVGAIAEHMSDKRGLVWPRAIAPFEVVIVPSSPVTPQAVEFYDKLVDHGHMDVVLDDRSETFGWKMQDADLIGYPITVVLGRAWRDGGTCEVQCRSLGVKEDVAVDDMGSYLENLLSQL
ncbi:hypothetical protein L249_7338 [Ophiocordyceps polyrhachis-furcata BCC 54312]|uniref:proline--tRNA ligase n=1 Tax=Ophiocordyceps polyrhachis-furcata BCC 54312 TaxID=1330021 RepID=A0A367LAK4_9HYPO|nr:hypothetical protein L249_7338 [Ophiocordyceps polyrhachis-furcata BCC 54312]